MVHPELNITVDKDTVLCFVQIIIHALLQCCGKAFVQSQTLNTHTIQG